MKTCKVCKWTEDEIGQFPLSYGNLCSACKNGRNRYNLNRRQQEEILEYQGGKCGIPTCGKEVKLFQGKGRKGTHVDHYGETRPYAKWESNWFVRGVICYDCNSFLGSNDIAFFEGVIEYLENPPAVRMRREV
jgi:hypothetical protein